MQGKTIKFKSPPGILGYASAVGKRELEGPLGGLFDYTNEDTSFGKESWEQAESALSATALQTAMDKAGVRAKDISLIFAGDLLNQCIASSFNLRDQTIPVAGIYSACATIAEGIALAAITAQENGICGALASSHFCTAERQFRYPLEYGGQRTPTSQWTATAAGCLLLSTAKAEGPFVTGATFGHIIDAGITDANNMGAAMAPAAVDTYKRFFTDTGTTPQDYDAIFTGDLGLLGSKLFCELMEEEGYPVTKVHKDCGLLLYDQKNQDVNCGGSGAGCSASVLCSYIFHEMKEKRLDRILFVATGALLSTVTAGQGESIPSVAHLVEIRNEV